MELADKINNFIKNETDDGFHDSLINRMEINLDRHCIKLYIEHNQNDKCVLSKLSFNNVHNFALVDNIECFIEEDEIYRFNVLPKGNEVKIKIIGSEGWILSFYTNTFETITEKLNESFNLNH